jgi:hypothetical protein
MLCRTVKSSGRQITLSPQAHQRPSHIINPGRKWADDMRNKYKLSLHHITPKCKLPLSCDDLVIKQADFVSLPPQRNLRTTDAGQRALT